MAIPTPGKPVRGSRSGVPIMALFDLLGRSWSIGVVWQLQEGPCTFRELKTDGHGEKPIEENDLRALLRASRPLGPLVREVYGMPAPAKKHGNR